MSKDRSKPRKEAYYIQVESVDKTPYFVDVSADLGKPMKFTKPLATVALRVTDTAVVVSALKVSTKMRTELAAAPLSLPPGPLARLERRLASLPQAPEKGQLVVEYDDQYHVLNISVDANGIASLETPAASEEMVFELPRRQLQLTFYMPGPKGRTIVAGWIGYQNKPGTPETLIRAAAYALNHLTSLMDFAAITGISKVQVPAPPGRFTIVRPQRKAADEVIFTVPVRLWTDAPPQPVASGTVRVHVDLDTANPMTGRLLLDMKPEPAMAEVFEGYRSVMDHAIQSALQNYLGPDEITDIVCDIALGDVGAGTIERLREAAGTVRGFDLNPRQSVPFQV